MREGKNKVGTQKFKTKKTIIAVKHVSNLCLFFCIYMTCNTGGVIYLLSSARNAIICLFILILNTRAQNVTVL